MMKTYLFVFIVMFGYFCTAISAEDIYKETDGTYNYIIITELDPPTDFCGKLTFYCSTVDNAFLALLPGADDSNPLYEIAFGFNGNIFTNIRRTKGGTNLASHEADVFPPHGGGVAKLGVEWNNGTITVSKYGPGAFTLTYSDPQPLTVANIAISTDNSRIGKWNFTTPVPAPSDCEVPVEQTTTADQTTAEQITSAASDYDGMCLCPCSSVGTSKWSYLANLNLTTEEIKIIMKYELEQIRQNLTIDKTETSAYLRTKISAPDGRVSSKSIGAVGAIFLTFVFLLVIGADLTNIFKNPPSCFRKK